ncbi:MAG: radical SAM protein [Candidatus Woesearchaeota archaeon]|jgi:radical SAM protein with 4Fe4S-binding SPASM domain
MGHYRKQMITLLTSSICDLKCSYCYVPQIKHIESRHKKIDVDFACVGIKDYFDNSKSKAIRFFGAGEPTKAFDEIIEIRNFAYKLAGNNLSVELQTNGYFDDTISEWVERNVTTLWISFDGLPDLHDSQRPLKDGGKSSYVILENIKRFSKLKNIQFGVRVTICNGNFHKQIEILEYLHSLGVKYVCASPSYSSTANPNVEMPYILEFSKYFVPAFFRAKELDMFYQTHLIVNFDENVDVYCRACLPCPHLTTDGFVTCCDWSLFGPKYLPGPTEKLIYGHYDRITKKIIYDFEKIREIQLRTTDTLKKGFCRDCVIINNCAGGCIGKTIVVTNDLYTPSKEWCEATKYLSKYIPLNKGIFPCFHS